MTLVADNWRAVVDGDAQAAVVCADCLDVLGELPAGSVGGVVTDPPYSISVRGASHTGVRGDRRNLDFLDGDDDWPAMIDRVVASARACLRLVDDRASMYWWCGHRQLGHMVTTCEDAGWSTRFLVWAKECPVPAPPRAGWPSGAELCLYAFRPGRKWSIEPARMPASNVIVADSYRHGQPGKVAHPTQKPERIMRLPVEASTVEGDVVLDPFCGSGTTGVGCAQTGRRFIGIEIDEGYAAIARDRIERELAQGKLFAGAKP